MSPDPQSAVDARLQSDFVDGRLGGRQRHLQLTSAGQNPRAVCHFRSSSARNWVKGQPGTIEVTVADAG